MADSSVNNKSNPNKWFVIGIFVFVIMAAESYLVYQTYSTRVAGTADFFSRWYGAKELIIHGRNPFDREIDREIQMLMFGRYSSQNEDQVGFAYPLYTIFLFWPLVFTPYAWAQAVWMVILQFALMGSAMLLMAIIRWRPPAWLFILTIFWSLFFYSGARAILLGQFSIIVALSILVSVWALQQGKDALAGSVLALATIKPQMVFLAIPFILLWAWRQHRWGVIRGFFIAMAILLATSIFWVPDWPLRFYNNIFAYAQYVDHGAPLENMTEQFASSVDHVLNPILSIALIGLMLWQWWLALTSQPERFLWVLNWTLLVSNLVAFRSATTNHVTLYLTLFLIFKRLAQSGWQVALVQLSSIVGLWVLFLTTIDTNRGENFEAIFMHGLLPSILIIYTLLDWRALKRATPPMTVNS